MKRVAIVQSSYIPWKGYFDLIRAADEFVLYDDVQFTRRDWRNRNRIKTAQGLAWLTIPVLSKGRYLQRICDTQVHDPDWARRHWSRLEQAYASAPHFPIYRSRIQSLYAAAAAETSLARINRGFIEGICDILGIATPIAWSMDYDLPEGRTARLVRLCRHLGATHYLSGPSARNYLLPGPFAAAGIALEFADYAGYPEYAQLHGPFEHRVTILDLLFNKGHDAPLHLKAVV